LDGGKVTVIGFGGKAICNDIEAVPHGELVFLLASFRVASVPFQFESPAVSAVTPLVYITPDISIRERDPAPRSECARGVVVIYCTLVVTDP